MSNLNPQQFGRVPDSVTHYRSGGIGHLEGDPSKSVVGMVPVDNLIRYREHDGNQNPHFGDHDQRVISGITEDIKSGVGIKEPIVMEYDHKNKWGWIGEGNHRLAAAQQAGISHVPVRVYGRSHANERIKRGIGAPMANEAPFVSYDPDYSPPDIHPHHFPGLRP